MDTLRLRAGGSPTPSAEILGTDVDAVAEGFTLAATTGPVVSLGEDDGVPEEDGEGVGSSATAEGGEGVGSSATAEGGEGVVSSATAEGGTATLAVTTAMASSAMRTFFQALTIKPFIPRPSRARSSTDRWTVERRVPHRRSAT
jgi:hypothetical protein